MNGRGQGGWQRRAARGASAWLTQHLQCAVASLGALWRAPLGTLLTVGVIGVALALPLALLLLVQELQGVSTHFGSNFEVSAFLHQEMDEGRGDEVARTLAARADVAGTRVIGRRQALAEFRAAAGVVGTVEGLEDDNPLPVVVVVTPSAHDRGSLDRLVAELSEMPQVESVLAERAWLDRLDAVLAVAGRALWVFAGLLGAGVMLVVGNTLRLTVEARRAEVEIAKLFGASDAFVRRPFLYQGLLYGVGGSLVGCALVIGGTLLLAGPLERLAEAYAVAIAPPAPRASHLAALLACGAALGLLGAWLSVGRHLRAVQPR